MRVRADEIEWDFFLAHAGPDKGAAETLFDHLSPRSRVFLDSRCLMLGDDWDAALAAAQRRALISVVLISKNTAGAYYQREEVAAAIALARENRDRHRVVPLYLGVDPERAEVPYGLRLKHGLSIGGSIDLTQAAARLLDLRRKLDGTREGTDTSAPVPQKVASTAGTAPKSPAAASPSPRPTSPDVLFAEAEARYEANDLRGAHDLFLRAAEQDHRKAQVALGYLHYFGEGCEENSTTAASWFRYAADRGDATAMYWLAMVHRKRRIDLEVREGRKGMGVDPHPRSEDHRREIALLQAAAAKGLAAAQCTLGVVYLNGDGVPEDFRLAMEHYRKAADRGNASAMGNISQLYSNGLGVPEDPVKAAMWKRKEDEQRDRDRSAPNRKPWDLI